MIDRQTHTHTQSKYRNPTAPAPRVILLLTRAARQSLRPAVYTSICLPSVEQSCVSACNVVRGEAPFCSGCLLEPTEAASDCSRLSWREQQEKNMDKQTKTHVYNTNKTYTYNTVISGQHKALLRKRTNKNNAVKDRAGCSCACFLHRFWCSIQVKAL